jgi:hypothetical protein
MPGRDHPDGRRQTGHVIRPHHAGQGQIGDVGCDVLDQLSIYPGPAEGQRGLGLFDAKQRRGAGVQQGQGQSKPIQTSHAGSLGGRAFRSSLQQHALLRNGRAGSRAWGGQEVEPPTGHGGQSARKCLIDRTSALERLVSQGPVPQVQQLSACLAMRCARRRFSSLCPVAPA